MDKLFYDEDSFLIKYKNEIIEIINELQEINFINIKSKEHEKYLEFSKNVNKSKNPIVNKDSIITKFSSLDKISSL